MNNFDNDIELSPELLEGLMATMEGKPIPYAKPETIREAKLIYALLKTGHVEVCKARC